MTCIYRAAQPLVFIIPAIVSREWQSADFRELRTRVIYEV